MTVKPFDISEITGGDVKDDDLKECLNKILCFLANLPKATSLKVKDGDLCGSAVYVIPSTGCYVAYSTDGSFVDIESDNTEVCIAGDVQECVLGAKPERWCLDTDGLAGNGNGNSSYTLQLPGGGEASLPVDFTVDDVVAALGDEFFMDDGALCSTAGTFSLTVSGITATGEPPDIIATLYQYIKTTLLTPLPAEEGELFKVPLTKGFNDEAMLAALDRISANQSRLCAKQDTANALAQSQLDKQCLQLDALANLPVTESMGLDKEAQTLTLNGDVVSDYPAGTTIQLQDSGKNICGSAQALSAAIDGDTTVITLTPDTCELAAGKTAVQVTQAKPTLQIAVAAVKNIVKSAQFVNRNAKG